MSKKKKTPYEVLGVSPSASKEEIDKAFRKKARKAHPDAGGDEKEFKEINECHALLISDERRDRYDNSGDDEEAKMPPMSLAMQVVSSCLNIVIQTIAKEGLNPATVDIALMMKKHMGDRIKEMREEIREFEKIQFAFLKIKKRFKRKKKSENEQENTIMEDSIDFHIEKWTRTIKIANDSLAGTIDAIKMVDQFMYERDKEPERPQFQRYSAFEMMAFSGIFRPGN